MKCKFCGRPFGSGGFCSSSPSKKHVAISDGIHCVFCAQKFGSGGFCTNSPSKKHQLDT